MLLFTESGIATKAISKPKPKPKPKPTLKPQPMPQPKAYSEVSDGTFGVENTNLDVAGANLGVYNVQAKRGQSLSQIVGL